MKKCKLYSKRRKEEKEKSVIKNALSCTTERAGASPAARCGDERRSLNPAVSLLGSFTNKFFTPPLMIPLEMQLQTASRRSRNDLCCRQSADLETKGQDVTWCGSRVGGGVGFGGTGGPREAGPRRARQR